MPVKITQKHIIEMAKIDQELRTQAKPGKELINYLIYAIDGIHNYRLRKIIEKYGYPTQKTMGKEVINSFWLLIQHQDYDIDLQENCLKNCDFEPKDKAYLTDRVLVNKGKKQIYGTQFKRIDGKLTPAPMENKANVNKKRKAAGLKSL